MGYPSLLLLLAASASFTRAASILKRWDQQCTSFTLPSIPENINATLAYAEYYPAGALFNASDPNASFESTNITDFCRIRVNISTYPGSQAASEIWLPDDWNGRFLGFGNGASGGGFAWSEMAPGGVNLGFASHATNGGHSSNGSDASWALGNPEALIDWNYRAMHQGTVVAKAIIAAYYGTSQFHSYYAVDDVRQSASALWVNNKVLPEGGPTWFSNETWMAIHKEVLKQCDGLDGLEDGIVANPPRCHFRPAAIACRPWETDTTNCLTPAQLDTLQYIYEPWKDSNDSYVWAGFAWGGELGMLAGNLLPEGQARIGQDGFFFRDIVYNDSNWDVADISYQSVVLGATTVGDNNDSANNPNITEFVARGGKMIQFVGWQDQYLSPYASIHWHDEVDAWMSSHTNYTTEDYYRLFIIPVGQPDSYSVNPPPSNDPQHNILMSILDWYENGNAPEQYIGTSYYNNTVELGISYQMPVCRWPKTTVYVGGDRTKAESFECRL
ncbi:feruloyl esterase-like protein [Pseudohyphozyma bogoriensis]|nr:feruloyl esterase-like protein [Pseudohyphozyma bogoriensis]